jgi:protein gp37
MSAKTSIEWTRGDDGTPGSTWNPVTGCTKVSPGCDNCYALTLAERFRGTPGHYFENGFDVQLRPDKLYLPIRWRKPRRVFVNSMSDLFHDDVPDEYIAQVFAVMALAPQHTFQILTKRHGRMRSLLSSHDFLAMIDDHRTAAAGDFTWPLPNVWLGVSVENQKWADIRIPALLDTPAAVRWLSCEPLLGPVDLWGPLDGHGGRSKLSYWLDGRPHWVDDEGSNPRTSSLAIGPKIDWVVVGGESGHHARAMHPEWARTIRDQCQHSGVPFHFKQWGEWAPAPWHGSDGATHAFTGGFIDDYTEHFMKLDHRPTSLERSPQTPSGAQGMTRPGKHAAGRELDGRTWDQYPATIPA